MKSLVYWTNSPWSGWHNEVMMSIRQLQNITNTSERPIYPFITIKLGATAWTRHKTHFQMDGSQQFNFHAHSLLLCCTFSMTFYETSFSPSTVHDIDYLYQCKICCNWHAHTAWTNLFMLIWKLSGSHTLDWRYKLQKRR